MGTPGVTEQLAQQILSLPMFPELREPEVERVARLITALHTRVIVS
jgi:dTDP-4-amino-4,6-dideoxygalactose transaminase